MKKTKEDIETLFEGLHEILEKSYEHNQQYHNFCLQLLGMKSLLKQLNYLR